jgi:hypothetical protein
MIITLHRKPSTIVQRVTASITGAHIIRGSSDGGSPNISVPGCLTVRSEEAGITILVHALLPRPVRRVQLREPGGKGRVPYVQAPAPVIRAVSLTPQMTYARNLTFGTAPPASVLAETYVTKPPFVLPGEYLTYQSTGAKQPELQSIRVRRGGLFPGRFVTRLLPARPAHR